MQEHGTPSTSEDFGNYVQFQSAVLRQLPRPHEISKGLRNDWIRKQANLRQALLDALVSAPTTKEITLDSLVEDVFTEELCTRLGFDKSNRGRFLNACRKHAECHGAEVFFHPAPITTLRQVIQRTRNEWRYYTEGVGKQGVRMIEAVLAVHGFDGLQIKRSQPG
jgi:hypothetical protein